ncbi:uncharacterized protein LOC111712971, partial [Eurytemora carolleeae]|uniref:uncharacterized protein LOC111712971 n=1 Tax=Eurytemora carolleeae TaxID=1294199 RepID=UPI000C7582E5
MLRIFSFCVFYLAQPAELGSDINFPVVRVKEILVPEYGVIGKNAVLSCSYTSTHGVYSVRWYKNGVEFYCYLPGTDNPISVFPAPGLHVEVEKSSATSVYLQNLTLDSTGRYRCEVSGESPFFPTDSLYEDMLVVALPRRGPRIQGAKPRLDIGIREINQ